MMKTILQDIKRFEFSTMPILLSLHDIDHVEPFEDAIWGVFTNSKDEKEVVCLKEAWSNAEMKSIKYTTIDGQVRSTDDGEYEYGRERQADDVVDSI